MEYLGPTERVRFPDPRRSNRHGVVAVGGNLSPGFLLSAYEQGIFPWYEEDPITWFSPDPRFLLPLDRFHIPSRLQRSLKRPAYRLTIDEEFGSVIDGCRERTQRRTATWITDEMAEGYTELHRLGVTHSIEVWQENQLVGGLYGVVTGALFAGESMFSRARDASKYALVALAGVLESRGAGIIDCQSYTPYLAQFGAIDVPRGAFLELLGALAHERILAAPWSELDPMDMLARGVALAERNERGAAAGDQ